MAPSLHHLLLLLLFFTVQSSFHFSHCSSQEPLVLPLKTEAIRARFTPKPSSSSNPTNKVHFSHNVSLTVTLTVGTPPQTVAMVLDTGSELSWLHCNRTQLFNSTFAPSVSSSYRPVLCSSQVCTNRTRTLSIPVSCDPSRLCHAVLSYADVTSIEGNLAEEIFRIGDSGFPGTVFGCMDSGTSSNPDEDSRTTGLLGMNRGSLSFATQTGYPKFSYCISGRDSSGVLLFGEANFPWLKRLSYTPMVQIPDPLPSFDRTAYTVNLEGIRVSNELLRVEESLLKPDHTGAGQTMVDSGTQFTFLLGPVYSALKDEFIKQTAGSLTPLGESGFTFQGTMDTCFRVSATRTNFTGLPAVTLMFQGAELSVSGDRLMYRVPGVVRGSDSVYCLTFGNSDLLVKESYVIGNHHQQNMWMEFDLGKSRVGLAEVSCELASQRLGMGPP